MLRRRMKGAFVALMVATAAATAGFAAAEDATLEGHWEGAIEIPGMKLEVNLDFTKSQDALAGDISIPMQNAKDLPLQNISMDGDDVTFAISGVPGDPTFKGKFSDDGKTLSGEFTQAGQTFPFSLTSGENMAAKARTALEGVDERIEELMKEFLVPGMAIGVVVDGEVVMAKGFGHSDIENEKTVTADTLFAIGSSTKAFTTFVMATLVDEGKLDWDKPVADYLPGFRLQDEYASTHITPRDLVTHRSGLPRHDLLWYNNQDISREELVKRLRYLPPNKQLRETWQYNNLMYLTAGYLIEQITGDTWEEAIRERIFEPLGMNDSVFGVEEMQQADDYALPYQEDDEEIKKINFRKIDVMGPAGSINSNVNDMNRWLMVHLSEGKIDGKSVIASSTLRELHTPQMVMGGIPQDREYGPMTYALGWFTTTYQGHYEVQHGGNIDGFSALVTLYPRDGVGIVALTNKNGTGAPSLVTRTIADLIFELPERDWIGESIKRRKEMLKLGEEGEERKGEMRIADAPPSRALEKFAGTYAHPGYGKITVEEEDGQLALNYNGMKMKLEHWHYDVFNLTKFEDEIVPEDMKITFVTNPRGQISGFDAQMDLFVDAVRFDRQADDKLSDPKYLERLAGKYEMATEVTQVSVKGNGLTLYVPGQPVYELTPLQDNEFALKGITGFSVKFEVPESGPATKAIFLQPNGIFESTRMEEE